MFRCYISLFNPIKNKISAWGPKILSALLKNPINIVLSVTIFNIN